MIAAPDTALCVGLRVRLGMGIFYTKNRRGGNEELKQVYG
jgi:hypothetical protein